jgi:predicted phosphodiesterase
MRVKANGIIFVGDPHNQSKAPGRRLDDYPRVVPEKMAFVRDMADRLGYAVVVCGDMVSKSQDSSALLMTRLGRAMRGEMPWFCLMGNHDIHEDSLTDDTTLASLEAFGLVTVFKEPGSVGFDLGEELVDLHYVPYGSELPVSLPEGEGKNILLTHADIVAQKDSSYPGALLNPQVKNCQIAVNGHVHKQQIGQAAPGGTRWFLPGSLARNTLDVADQVPRVLVYTGGQMTSVEVPHEKDVFDMTGKMAPAKKNVSVMAGATSQFADLLKKESALDIQRSAGGDVLREDLSEIFEAKKVKKDVQEIVISLLDTVVEKEAAA